MSDKVDANALLGDIRLRRIGNGGKFQIINNHQFEVTYKSAMAHKNDTYNLGDHSGQTFEWCKKVLKNYWEDIAAAVNQLGIGPFLLSEINKLLNAEKAVLENGLQEGKKAFSNVLCARQDAACKAANEEQLLKLINDEKMKLANICLTISIGISVFIILTEFTALKSINDEIKKIQETLTKDSKIACDDIEKDFLLLQPNIDELKKLTDRFMESKDETKKKLIADVMLLKIGAANRSICDIKFKIDNIQVRIENGIARIGDKAETFNHHIISNVAHGGGNLLQLFIIGVNAHPALRAFQLGVGLTHLGLAAYSYKKNVCSKEHLEKLQLCLEEVGLLKTKLDEITKVIVKAEKVLSEDAERKLMENQDE